MELQLAQNDPRGQDWCKVNLLVTGKSHSGTPFSLYHLIMTLLCSSHNKYCNLKSNTSAPGAFLQLAQIALKAEISAFEVWWFLSK